MVAFKLRLKMQNTRMQFQINDNVQLAQSLNPLNDVVKVQSIDYSADFNDMLNKLNYDSYICKELWILI